MKNAIILCSGGLDSVITSYYVRNKLKYDNLVILFFNYGQKAINLERKFSKKCAVSINARFIEVQLKWLGEISTSLINKKGKIKELARKDLKNSKKESDKFYVPCRNSIFLINALSLAESLFIQKKEVYDIFVGFKCEGKESYPDTTIKFVKEINKLSAIACTKNFKVLAPLIKKDKEDIILLGKKLGVNFKESVSCYSPVNGKSCGYCLACKLRQEGFYWANIEDPTKYNNV